MTDVCDEVAPGLLDALSGCLIVREDENQALIPVAPPGAMR